MEQKISQLLIKSRKTLAIAESCTGGLISDRITNIAGSSNFLKLALVAYSNEAKSKFLKIPKHFLKKHGAVSAQTAVAMAQGVQKIFNTDFGIGVTGIAGPTGGSKTKPIGLVFIAVCTQEESLCLECRFQGSRKSIKSQSATQALKLLNEFLI